MLKSKRPKNCSLVPKNCTDNSFSFASSHITNTQAFVSVKVSADFLYQKQTVQSLPLSANGVVTLTYSSFCAFKCRHRVPIALSSLSKDDVFVIVVWIVPLYDSPSKPSLKIIPSSLIISNEYCILGSREPFITELLIFSYLFIYLFIYLFLCN